jgi:hypothetical protein
MKEAGLYRESVALVTNRKKKREANTKFIMESKFGDGRTSYCRNWRGKDSSALMTEEYGSFELCGIASQKRIFKVP